MKYVYGIIPLNGIDYDYDDLAFAAPDGRFQVVRNGVDFRFEKFHNVADREFAVSQRIHDFQAMGVTQSLETFRAEIRVKNFLCHDNSPLRNKI